MARSHKHDSSTQQLLEVGRALKPVHYDIEVGLARHQRLVHDGAPLSDWAVDASSALAPNPLASSLVGKALIVGAIAIGAALAGLAWQMLKPASTQKPEPGVRVETSASTATARALPAVPPPVAVTAAAAPVAAPEPARNPSRHATSGRVRVRTPQRDQVPARTTNAEQSEREVEPAVSARAENVQAPASEVPPAASAGDAPETASDIVEMRELAAAEGLLTRDPGRALSLVKQSDQHFPRGYFRLERAYVAIMALINLGRLDEANAQAERFLGSYPQTSYAARIRRALEVARQP